MAINSNGYERTVGLDFIRACEGAALSSFWWIGKGEKEKADESASDALRGTFDRMNICGEVVIGEGIKDNAPGLFKGERVGTWEEGAPRFEIALDPIDGTTNLSKGLPNAISCIAASMCHSAEQYTGLVDIPAHYMEKLAYGQTIQNAIITDASVSFSLDMEPKELICIAAKILSKNISDVVVMTLDRPRNEHIIDAVRTLGANLRLVSDGDITAALAPALIASGIDLYMGIGGSPEGVLTAVGMRCLGGGLQTKMWPKDDKEHTDLSAIFTKNELNKIFNAEELAKGEDLLFIATGILDSPFIQGITVQKRMAATHSVFMRVKNRTVRFIEGHHHLDHKEIPLRSQKVKF